MEEFVHRINLNYDVSRGINYPKYMQYIKESCKESIPDTIKLLFYLRDKKNGKGERKLFRDGLVWMGINYPDYVSQVIHLVPVYGRWDDLFCFFPDVIKFKKIDYINANYCSNITQKTLEKCCKLQNEFLEFYVQQLQMDRQYLLKNESNKISLAAKWAPTEGCHWDKKYKLARILCKKMGIHPKTYRLSYLVPLRSELNIVEKKLCKKKWKKIDFSQVPICARIKYRKTFEKYRETAWHYWKRQHIRDKKPTPFVHDIFGKYNKSELSTKINKNNEKRWMQLISKYQKSGKFTDIIPIVDTTGSMYGRIMKKFYINDRFYLNISLGNSLLLASCLTSIFKNTMINFDTSPTFNSFLLSQPLLEIINKFLNIDTTFQINIFNIYQKYLERCKQSKISSDKVPNKIIIFSDQNSQDIDPDFSKNLKKIEELFENEDYSIPTLFIWNLEGTDFKFHRKEWVVNVFGFSKYIYQMFLKYGSLDFKNTLTQILADYNFELKE